jgi:hypothetical protein
MGALTAFACAATREPQRSSDGLVRIKSWKPGNLFVDPAHSIDDYDDVWVAGAGIHFAADQEPLAETDQERVRRTIHDAVAEQIPSAGLRTGSEPGPCTVKLSVFLANLELPRPGVATARNNGGMTVIFEYRDSQTGAPMVRYGRRRDLGRLRSASDAEQLDRLQATVETAVSDVNSLVRDSLPVNPSGARAALGCKGAIGEARQRERAAR